MNISANDIAQQMDSRLRTLQQAIASGDEALVIECATVIEAYCQLLKSVPAVKQDGLERKPASMPAVVSSPSLSTEGKGEALGNLLDF